MLTLAAFTVFSAFAPTPSAALPPGFAIEEIHDALVYPTTLRFAPDGRLFFTELGGRIAYYPTPTFPTASTWATATVSTAGERGLLGMAFHPDFPDSPYVYVYYTNASPLGNRLVRFVQQGSVGGSPAILLDLLGASLFHHGGRIAFGPDGMIYVSYGDQENLPAVQSITARPGKIFRLTRGGQPAPGNPWGPTNPAAALGVRNVFGLCFDPLEGQGYFTDNGPECDDEVDFFMLGANYGWGPGDFCGGQPAGTTAAVANFSPPIAPTGACVYRGAAYPARFDGNLFFGSFNDRRVRRIRFVSGRPDLVDTLEVFADLPEAVLDVTVGPDNCLWVATISKIYRIVYLPAVGVGEPGGRDDFEIGFAPNPFRATVSLSPHGAPPEARIEIFDLQGRRLRGWGPPLPPRVVWDGRAHDGASVPAGVYLVRLTAPGLISTRRLVRIAP